MQRDDSENAPERDGPGCSSVVQEQGESPAKELPKTARPIAHRRFQRCPCGKSHKLMPEYSSWRHAIHRCTNPDYDGFAHYGARGITICERWRESFHAFLDDMGQRPNGTSLERKDNERGYEPDNCVWATSAEQARNRRSVKLDACAAEDIRRMRASGVTQRRVAKAFGVSRTLVRKIEDGQIWR